MMLKKMLKTRTKTPNVLTPAGLPAWRDGEKSLFLAGDAPRACAQNLIDALDAHKHLREAKLLVLFRMGIKANADGLVELGKASKATPYLKLLAGEPDFILTLNGEAWAAATERNDHRLLVALVDHELTHCGATVAGKFIADGKELLDFVKCLGGDHVETCDDVRDNKGRVLVRYLKRRGEIKPALAGKPAVAGKPGDDDYAEQPFAWRIRKHDIQDFCDVVERWGAWTEIHKRIIDVMEKAEPQTPLLTATG